MISTSGGSLHYRILFVDDEEPWRRLMQRTLERRGHHCDVAANGRVAARLAGVSTYDVVVTDLRMPEVHGHTLCRDVLNRHQPPGLLVVTGVVEPRLERDLKARGVDDLIYKPVGPNDLASRIESLALSYRQSPAPEQNSTSALESQFAESAVIKATAPYSLPELSADQYVVAILLDTPDRNDAVDQAIRADRVCSVRCHSSEDLWRHLNAHRIDVVVIQQRLSGFLTGIEILERLSRELPQCTSVLLADSSDGVQSRADELGVHAVLPADIDPLPLTTTVQNLLSTMTVESDEIPFLARRLLQKCPHITPPPQLLIRLLEYMNRDLADIPLDRLADDIALDPHATVALLRLTNSSDLGLRHEIRSVSDAVRLLGPKAAISQVFSKAVVQSVDSFAVADRDFIDWYHRRCVLIATTASVFAERLETVSPDLAFTLGMLQDIGVMVMFHGAGHRYSSLIDRFRRVAASSLDHMENEDFSITHADTGAALLQQWGLPDSIVRAVFGHHKPHAGSGSCAPLRRVLAIGEAVANMNDVRHPRRCETLNRLLDQYGESQAEACQVALREAIMKSADASRLFTLSIPPKETLNRLLTEITT